ncbi:hypothetical protein WDZ92_36410, partial [Nostoc sp. NIES-2111]
IVLNWPSWPETFSFTAFEAMEAGAFVLTNDRSGNVADAVRQYYRGLVLHGEEELLQIFGGDELQRLATESRRLREKYFATRRQSAFSLALLQGDSSS